MPVAVVRDDLRGPLSRDSHACKKNEPAAMPVQTGQGTRTLASGSVPRPGQAPLSDSTSGREGSLINEVPAAGMQDGLGIQYARGNNIINSPGRISIYYIHVLRYVVSTPVLQ